MSERIVRKFVKERDEALLSLNKRKIQKFARKWGVPDVTTSDEAFWRGVHKARIECLSLPIAERQKSAKWLADRGSPRLYGGNPHDALAETPAGAVKQ